MTDFLVLPTPAIAEKVEHTGPAQKERVIPVPHREQLVNTPAFAKRYKTICPDHQHVRRESQGEREPHLGEREGDQSRSMGRKK